MGYPKPLSAPGVREDATEALLTREVGCWGLRGPRSGPGQFHAGTPALGAETCGSKLPCGSLDGTRKPSSARLRPGRTRGSVTVKDCQGLVERLHPGLRAMREREYV